MSLLSTSDTNKLNNSLLANGIALGTIINQLYDAIASANLGFTADDADIDSVALNAAAFSQDTADTTGLTFAWNASRFSDGINTVSVAAGTVALSASHLNYVECDLGGTVTANITGFTSGRLALFEVQTGVAGITTVTAAKNILVLPRLVIAMQLGTINATANFLIPLPDREGILSSARFATSSAVAGDDTNYWTFALKNLSTDGTGTTDMLDTGSANTTKATGGSAIVANARRSLTLNATAANLKSNATDLAKLTVTATGAPTAMSNCALILEV